MSVPRYFFGTYDVPRYRYFFGTYDIENIYWYPLSTLMTVLKTLTNEGSKQNRWKINITGVSQMPFDWKGLKWRLVLPITVVQFSSKSLHQAIQETWKFQSHAYRDLCLYKFLSHSWLLTIRVFSPANHFP